eukprot:9678375-Alexandrium_andersonii.AAC.1
MSPTRERAVQAISLIPGTWPDSRVREEYSSNILEMRPCKAGWKRAGLAGGFATKKERKAARGDWSSKNFITNFSSLVDRARRLDVWWSSTLSPSSFTMAEANSSGVAESTLATPGI